MTSIWGRNTASSTGIHGAEIKLAAITVLVNGAKGTENFLIPKDALRQRKMKNMSDLNIISILGKIVFNGGFGFILLLALPIFLEQLNITEENAKEYEKFFDKYILAYFAIWVLFILIAAMRLIWR